MDDRVSALTKQRYISLTTFRRDGRPVATPVWFAFDGDRILVWTDKVSGKAKRIRATGRATVAPSSSLGKSTGPEYEASACMLPDEQFEQAMRLLTKKYRMLKPLVDAWSSIGLFVRRKTRPVEIFLEITLT